MNNIEINQTVGPEETLEDGEIVFEDGAFSGFEGKTINITDSSSSGSSDVEAGIQFIYHMREHLIDIGIATVYGLTVYAIFLWITKKIKG